MRNLLTLLIFASVGTVAQAAPIEFTFASGNLGLNLTKNFDLSSGTIDGVTLTVTGSPSSAGQLDDQGLGVLGPLDTGEELTLEFDTTVTLESLAFRFAAVDEQFSLSVDGGFPQTYTFPAGTVSNNFTLVDITAAFGEQTGTQFTIGRPDSPGGNLRVAQAAVSQIPEPASITAWCVIGLVSAGAGYYRRRRNRKTA